MIKVIIERHIAEGLEPNYESAALEILSASVRASGFISGESLRNMDDPMHRFVICKWRSRADWDRWYISDDRKSLMSQLSLMLDREEHVTILNLSE